MEHLGLKKHGKYHRLIIDDTPTEQYFKDSGWNIKRYKEKFVSASKYVNKTKDIYLSWYIKGGIDLAVCFLEDGEHHRILHTERVNSTPRLDEIFDSAYIIFNKHE
jgi:hypothetical protein